MAVRDSMAGIILQLRYFTATEGDADWTDQQLQDVLDRHARFLTKREIVAEDTGVFNIPVPPSMEIEETAYYDASDNALTPDSENLLQRRVTIGTAETAYLSATMYNMNEAAADVWERKAAETYGLIQGKAGQHTFHLQQKHEHCKQMAAQFRNRTIRAVGGGKRWRL